MGSGRDDSHSNNYGRKLPTPEQTALGLKNAAEVNSAAIAARRSIQVELQVTDNDHASSEEVLQFCLKELEAGTTYNDLRMKLGVGTAATDRRWRIIREALVELILPDSEEEALRTDAALSGYMIGRIETFMKKIEVRADESRGEDNEHHFLKLELDSMKLIMEKYSKRTEHFLKMKDIKGKEKRTGGTTIVFNNEYKIARPGDVDVTPLQDAARLMSRVQDIEDV